MTGDDLLWGLAIVFVIGVVAVGCALFLGSRCDDDSGYG